MVLWRSATRQCDGPAFDRAPREAVLDGEAITRLSRSKHNRARKRFVLKRQRARQPASNRGWKPRTHFGFRVAHRLNMRRARARECERLNEHRSTWLSRGWMRRKRRLVATAGFLVLAALTAMAAIPSDARRSPHRSFAAAAAVAPMLLIRFDASPRTPQLIECGTLLLIGSALMGLGTVVRRRTKTPL